MNSSSITPNTISIWRQNAADVQQKNSKIEIDLFELAKNNSLNSIDSFLMEKSNGEDSVNLKEYINIPNNKGQTVIHHLALATLKRDAQVPMKILMYLVFWGGDLNAKDNENCTPMHFVLPLFAKWCFEHGGSEEGKNKLGLAPIESRAKKASENPYGFRRSTDEIGEEVEQVKAIEEELLGEYPILKDKKEEIYKPDTDNLFNRNENNFSLIASVKRAMDGRSKDNSYEKIKKLFEEEAKPDPNVKDSGERSAVRYALSIEDSRIIKIIIENGGNPNAKDGYNKSVIMHAVSLRNPDPELIDLLIEKEADIHAEIKIKGNVTTVLNAIKELYADKKDILEKYKNISKAINSEK